MPHLPRVVAARPHPSAGALLEGPRAGCGTVEQAQGAEARPGGVVSGTESSARRKEKRGKELTCGPWLAEGERERGESSRARKELGLGRAPGH
jgi:hypothetical protein